MRIVIILFAVLFFGCAANTIKGDAAIKNPTGDVMCRVTYEAYDYLFSNKKRTAEDGIFNKNLGYDLTRDKLDSVIESIPLGGDFVIKSELPSGIEIMINEKDDIIYKQRELGKNVVFEIPHRLPPTVTVHISKEVPNHLPQSLSFELQTKIADEIEIMGVVDDVCHNKLIHLQWRPTDSISDTADLDLGKIRKLKLKIGNIIDARENRIEIGCNSEASLRRYYLSKEDVAAFVTERFCFLLSHFKINFTCDTADILLTVELKKFYVNESSSYKGEVTIGITAQSTSGSILWSGVVSGTSSNWGLSFRTENYYECIGNAIVAAVNNLLRNKEFVSVFNKTPS